MLKETVLCLCAHNDDHILGAGGTLAKYAKEGKHIIVVIFSYGELTHPHLKRKIIVETRVKEAKRAEKLLGTDELYFIGLKEGNFVKEINDKKILKKLINIIKERKPSKIFTHSRDDPHRDHKAVYNFTLNLVQKTNYKGDVFTFNVWNFFLNLRKGVLPKLVVDISDTFKAKIEALNKHKSQKLILMQFMWNVYLQAWLNGILHNMKYAEVFYKIK
ncbi:PIG-L family deacetylase [Candidatus Woesearchaeota archaeon]|nr:PIG-L family deacetylase [Candidatus Woesearchaeota archaeon]